MTKMLIPDVDTRMSQKELSHVEKINGDFNDTLLALMDDETEKDKTKLILAKILLKSNRDAQGVKPSATENVMQQYMRMKGQGALDEQLNIAAGWSKTLITEVAGGGLAGVGILGFLGNMIRRKSKALRVVNSELSEDAKAVVKKALQHTGLEKEVT
jgi:hypothetical protein